MKLGAVKRHQDEGTDKFRITEQMEMLVSAGGKIHGMWHMLFFQSLYQHDDY